MNIPSKSNAEKSAFYCEEPENSEYQLMTEPEYVDLRAKLLKVKTKLFEEPNSQDKKIEQWLELSEKTFNFSRYAHVWFAQGDMDTKRAVFVCLGSHPVL